MSLPVRGTASRSATSDRTNRHLLELIGWCDVVVAFGFLLVEFPRSSSRGKVVVADLYDPFTLEVLVQRAGDPPEVARREHWGALRAMNELVRRGDFFLVASERQRDLLCGMLGALNRLNPDTYAADPSLDGLVALVPFGLPPEPPRRGAPALRGVHPGVGADDLVLLWAGGIYEWFDPLTLIEGIARLGSPEVKLFFMGTRHPNPEVPGMAMVGRARALADRLGLAGRQVFFNEGWVPYDERVDYLLDADVGVSTHFRHVETGLRLQDPDARLRLGGSAGAVHRGRRARRRRGPARPRRGRSPRGPRRCRGGHRTPRGPGAPEALQGEPGRSRRGAALGPGRSPTGPLLPDTPARARPRSGRPAAHCPRRRT